MEAVRAETSGQEELEKAKEGTDLAEESGQRNPRENSESPVKTKEETGLQEAAKEKKAESQPGKESAEDFWGRKNNPLGIWPSL